MRVGWLFALCGCDAVLHLAKVDPMVDAAPDSGTDAPPQPFCATRGSAFLCADFEDAMPMFHADGTAYNFPNIPADVTVKTTPSTDGSGLKIDTTGSAYSFGTMSGTSITTTMIDIEMMVRFDRVNAFTGTIPIASIGVAQNDASFGSCRVELQLIDAPKRLTMQDYCGTNLYPDVLLSFPPGWIKLGLVLDLANERATTFVNGNQKAQLSLGSGLSAGAAPFAYAGFYGPGNVGVSFDDVAAVVTP